MNNKKQTTEERLKSALTDQHFEKSDEDYGLLLEQAKAHASSYAKATEGIAVVSDFRHNECHIYSGIFGQYSMGLPEYLKDANSAFEDIVFSRAKEDELIERHVLELRFFNFLKHVRPDSRTHYQATCILNFHTAGDNKTIKILHSTRYFKCDNNSNVLLGICTYLPYPVSHNRFDGTIVNLVTGRTVEKESYEVSDHKILSRRQTEILSLIAKGFQSKNIADRLCISVHTVNRHRQDILTSLRVANTAAAVEIALRMKLI